MREVARIRSEITLLSKTSFVDTVDEEKAIDDQTRRRMKTEKLRTFVSYLKRAAEAGNDLFHANLQVEETRRIADVVFGILEVILTVPLSMAI